MQVFGAGQLVGATWPLNVATIWPSELRKLAPATWMLLPGASARGGEGADDRRSRPARRAASWWTMSSSSPPLPARGAEWAGAPRPWREKARQAHAGSSGSSRPRARRRRPPRGPRQRRRRRAASGRGAYGRAAVPAPVGGVRCRWPSRRVRGGRGPRRWWEAALGLPGAAHGALHRAQGAPTRRARRRLGEPARPSLDPRPPILPASGPSLTRGPRSGVRRRRARAEHERSAAADRRIRDAPQEAAMRSDLMPPSRRSPVETGRHTGGAEADRDHGGVAAAVAALLSHYFGGPPPVRVEFWDGTCARPGRRARAAGQVSGRRAPAAVVTGGAGPGPGLRRRGPGIRG